METNITSIQYQLNIHYQIYILIEEPYRKYYRNPIVKENTMHDFSVMIS